MQSRPAISEVIGSLSTLAITMALLGGVSTIALLSIHGAATQVETSAQRQQAQIGILLEVVGTQTNSSGTFVWVCDYGWASAPVQSVTFGAQAVTWSTTCEGNWEGSMCVVTLPPLPNGSVNLLIGGRTVEASV